MKGMDQLTEFFPFAMAREHRDGGRSSKPFRRGQPAWVHKES
uniref:Uncharacterized protein n=1 Tax=Pseudomonas fluorescens (strain SBW25) TaxID=216595 RepID=A0A0G4E5C7_PSEFS|nr:hypothetical protein PQBR57_0224 [Pseudomonas fluorescens SBW25]